MPDIDPEKLPWLQFWVSDWRSDMPLRMCSSAARGLWIDMLCLMHHCEPYGTLCDNAGKPMPSATLSKLIGGDLPDVETWLLDLEKNKIFSRDSAGRIYSRRMQRDHQLRGKRSAAGRKGGSRSARNRSK